MIENIVITRRASSDSDLIGPLTQALLGYVSWGNCNTFGPHPLLFYFVVPKTKLVCSSRVHLKPFSLILQGTGF